MSTTSEKLSYLNETKGKIKRAINNFGGKLTNDSTFRSYPDELYNAWDNIFNQLPHVEDTSTSPSLSSTLEAPMRNNLKGNTYQTQYTGKNLLPPTIATETKNGITLTNNGDGSYTLTGTYSTSTTFDMALPATLNGTYSFSGNNPTAGKNIQFRILKSSGSPWSTYLSSVNRTSTNQTIENGITQEVRIVGSFTSGFTFKPQLESGSTATSYEPYVGGVATPNPTNPADVNVVSGDNEINVVGKNLFYGELEQGSYDNGTGVKQANTGLYRNSIYLAVQPSTTYTLSINGVSQKYVLLYYKSDKTFISVNTGLTTGTFTTPSNCYYINFRCFGADYTSDYANLKIQLEKGSSASTYEVKGNTYNIDLPVENLWHLDNATVNGVTLTNNTDGSITLNGTCTSTSQFRTMFDTSLSNDTYTLGFVSSMALSSGSLFVRTRNSSGTLAQNIDVKVTSANQTITSDIKYLDITIINGVTYNNVNLKIQLEKGSKVNDFTPYGTTPIELCKIGNYQDYFAKSDGSNLFNYNLFETFTTTIQYVSINLKPNTKYTMSSNIPITSGVGTNLFFMKDGETASTSTNGVRPDTSVTLTTDSTGVVKVGYRTGTGVSANPKTDYWYMINEGSTALPYQPYGVGKWYLHKEIGKVILNGTEPTWARADGNNDYRDFRIPLSDIALANTEPIGYIDNRFVAKTSSYWNENGEHLVQMNDKRLSFRIAVSRLTDSTRESWISWLTNNHITTYYALATPTSTEITDTTLINQLEELYIAKSKENQTNISQINNDLPFIINATALLDANTYIMQLEAELEASS